MAGGWASLGLMPELVEAVEEVFGWTLPTAIQDECIPLILGGGDVMASAETGSGKTAAFALPALQLCHEAAAAASAAPINSSVSGRRQQDLKQITLLWEMSVRDRSPLLAVQPKTKHRSRLVIQSKKDSKRWSGIRSQVGILGVGKWYYECTIRDDVGIVRVGWSTLDASLELGLDSKGYGYGGTGFTVHAKQYEPYPRPPTDGEGEAEGETNQSKHEGVSFEKGDVIGCWLDLKEQQKISFSKNGTPLGIAFSSIRHIVSCHDPPEAYLLALFPTVSLKNAECEINFGATPLQYLPSGYQPLLTAKSEACMINQRDADIDTPGNDDTSFKPTTKNMRMGGPMAIILEPTRDLAEQTYRTCVDLASRMPPMTTNNQQYMVSAALLVGGMNPQPTLDLLKKNEVDILVGTPPIVSSMIQRRKLLTSNCQLFILDEADQLLVDSSNRDKILEIYQSFQKGRREAMNRLQVCFFSATLHSREVQTLTERICHRPTWVDLRGKDNSKLPDTIHHCIICVHPSSYETMVQTQSPGLVTTDAVHRGGEIGDTVNFSSLSEKEADSERIKLLKPRVLVDVMEQFKMEQVLVFCRTNLDCDLLEQYLKQVGGADGINRFSCRVLAGMRSMTERQANLKAFMEGEIRVLIATDVAARGIDIPELPFVVQMILPFGTKPSETYVHRVGRVGRANRMGLAISIIGEAKEKVWWCQNGQKPPCANTSLFENGGNCKWFDERSVLKQVTSMLKSNKIGVTSLTWRPNERTMLPGELQCMVEGRCFGSHVNDFLSNHPHGNTSDMDPQVQAYLSDVSAKVSELGATEFALQSEFWKLKDRFRIA